MSKLIFLLTGLFLLLPAGSTPPSGAGGLSSSIHLAWREAGLTERAAAAHLLDRLAYGARPGEVDAVVEKGLDEWLLAQLDGKADADFEARLAERYPALALDGNAIGRTYPSAGVKIIFGAGLLRDKLQNDPEFRRELMAMRRGSGGGAAGARGGGQRSSGGKPPGPRRGSTAGGLAPDAANMTDGGAGGQEAQLNRILRVEPLPTEDDTTGRARFQAFGRLLGLEPMEDLMYQLMAQKLDRALHAEAQLTEVLTDFWFNHFNVSITRVNDGAPQVLSYERDAIRPNVLGDFRTLLGATAKHPAMLIYLDNNRSNAPEGVETLAPRMDQGALAAQLGAGSGGNQRTGTGRRGGGMGRGRFGGGRLGGRNQGGSAGGGMGSQRMGGGMAGGRMGIDTGQLKQFMQQPGINENYARELFELHTLGVDGGYTQQDIQEAARAFTGWKASPLLYPLPEATLAKVENLLGRRPHAVLDEGFYFDPGWHDATAKTVLGHTFKGGGGVAEGEKILDLAAAHPSTARHLARKFAERFVSDAPSASIVDALAQSFATTDGDLKELVITLVGHPDFWRSRTEKIKTPLEYVVSSVRALGAKVEEPRALAQALTRMGQPLYAYQAPTGYPDRAEQWTNGAALLNRMNFGLDLAANRVPGVDVVLMPLNRNREPESPRDALETFAPLLLPTREVAETIDLLTPVITDPRFAEKVAAASGNAENPPLPPGGGNRPAPAVEPNLDDTMIPYDDAPTLQRVVGLLLGSPEFQRQ